MKRVLCIILSVLLLASLSLPAAAASSKATTMALDSASGTVTVKNAAGTAQTVRSGLRLYSGYSVSTALSSYAYISLDSSKVVKLDASSELSVQKAGKKLELQLSSGNLVFDVSAPLSGSESLNIRTSTMVTGVRGTAAEISVKSLTLDFSVWTMEEQIGKRVYISPDGAEAVEVAENGAVSYRNGDVVIPVRRGTDAAEGVSAATAGQTPEELARSLSFQVTEIKLLSGTLEIHPLGLLSEAKTVILHAGEKVSSLNAYIPEKLALDDLSGSVLTFLKENVSLQERILSEGVYSEEELKKALASAEEKLAEAQAAAAEKQAEIDAAAKKTVKSSDQVFTDSSGDAVAVVYRQITFDTTGAGYEWLNAAGTPITSAAVADGADYTFGIRIKDGYRTVDHQDPEVFASEGAAPQELESGEGGSFTLAAVTGDFTVTTNTALIEADDSALTLPTDAVWDDIRSALFLAAADPAIDTVYITPDTDVLPADLTANTSVTLSEGVDLILRSGVSLTVPETGIDADFVNNGRVFVNEGASFTVSGTVQGTGTLVNEGILTVAAGGSFAVSYDGMYSNSLVNYETILVNGAMQTEATVDNQGTFTVSAGGTFENRPAGSFENSGTLTINGSMINNGPDGPLTNDGTLTINGELENHAPVTNDGTLVINGKLSNIGNGFLVNNGSFTIASAGRMVCGNGEQEFVMNADVINNGTFVNFAPENSDGPSPGWLTFGAGVTFHNNGTFLYWDDDESDDAEHPPVPAQVVGGTRTNAYPGG